MSGDLSWADIERLIGSKLGTEFDVSCPRCGPDRSTRATQTKPVLHIWREKPDFATYKCARCEIKGSVKAPTRPNGSGKPPRQKAKVVAEYVYRTATGEPYLRVLRLEPKDFPQSRWTGSGWEWGKPKGEKIPYRLPELLASAEGDDIVFVVEGEGKADMLGALGLIATCASEGADKWPDYFAKYFEGRTVFVLPDNDQRGAKHARQVASNLSGVTAEVRVVALPGLAEGEDIKEWLRIPGNDKAKLVDRCWSAPVYRPVKEQDAADAKVDDLEATLERLAAQPLVLYDRVRQDEARRLGVRVTTLDAEVERRRPRTSSAEGGNDSLIDPDPEPWPSPVDGADLLDSLTATIKAHMILKANAAEAIALWVVHAHAHDCFDVSPILAITSPTPECGKTTLCSILVGLTPRALPTSNITVAALFRTVEKCRPTLVLDEADTFAKDDDVLRGIVNSGHNKAGAFVIRTVGDNFEPRRFRTWAPKAVASIGKLTTTWASRSIHVELTRKTAAEEVTPIRNGRLGHLEPLKRQAARFVADNVDALREADPNVPGLDGRPADNWRPLIAIADLAGGEWPARARRIAQGSAGRSETTASIMLLEDIRRIFAEPDKERITSKDLVKALAEMEDRPWPEWKNGKPITERQAASLLGSFKITPKVIRLGTSTPRGYERRHFDDAFARYLPPILSATPQQAAEDLGFDGFSSATSPNNVADENGSEPAENNDCCGVADRKGGTGGNGYDDDELPW
jgi:putative DNA primase/helicase